MNEKTGKPILFNIFLKKGDKVKVISGGDKGLVSEVMEARLRRPPSRRRAAHRGATPPAKTACAPLRACLRGCLHGCCLAAAGARCAARRGRPLRHQRPA